MGNEENSAGQATAKSGHVLSFQDGIYRLRLRLSVLDVPYEVVLHGVSCLTDALSILRFFEGNLLSHVPLRPGQSEDQALPST